MKTEAYPITFRHLSVSPQVVPRTLTAWASFILPEDFLQNHRSMLHSTQVEPRISRDMKSLGAILNQEGMGVVGKFQDILGQNGFSESLQWD